MQTGDVLTVVADARYEDRLPCLVVEDTNGVKWAVDYTNITKVENEKSIAEFIATRHDKKELVYENGIPQPDTL